MCHLHLYDSVTASVYYYCLVCILLTQDNPDTILLYVCILFQADSTQHVINEYILCSFPQLVCAGSYVADLLGMRIAFSFLTLWQTCSWCTFTNKRSHCQAKSRILNLQRERQNFIVNRNRLPILQSQTSSKPQIWSTKGWFLRSLSYCANKKSVAGVRHFSVILDWPQKLRTHQWLWPGIKDDLCQLWSSHADIYDVFVAYQQRKKLRMNSKLKR